MTLNEPWEVDDVPPSAWCRRRSSMGSVEGLDDEELADPVELERQVFREEWGPVLALPARGKGNPILPAVDESGGLDWGAFATVDFERSMPEFDKARYKADKLREKLRDVLIMFSIVTRRLPRAKALVLKYLRMGIIELDHIANDDMRALARLHLRARKLQQQIRALQKVSRTKVREDLAAVLS
ncbi:MAG: hypothetical protein JXQ75_04645 [Phycisphaerae bacterium]|nr:hypothetical protein [Phycisphaerae bacterium]